LAIEGDWVKVADDVPTAGAGLREIAPAAQSDELPPVKLDVTVPAAPGLVLAAELTKSELMYLQIWA
jgi:hypothetical protein